MMDPDWYFPQKTVFNVNAGGDNCCILGGALCWRILPGDVSWILWLRGLTNVHVSTMGLWAWNMALEIRHGERIINLCWFLRKSSTKCCSLSSELIWVNHTLPEANMFAPEHQWFGRWTSSWTWPIFRTVCCQGNLKHTKPLQSSSHSSSPKAHDQVVFQNNLWAEDSKHHMIYTVDGSEIRRSPS